jgi:hypothetical protein
MIATIVAGGLKAVVWSLAVIGFACLVLARSRLCRDWPRDHHADDDRSCLRR